MASGRTKKIKPLAIILVVIAIVLVIGGIIYLTVPANDLPGFMPGKPNYTVDSDRTYSKRGIALLILAAISLVGAWYASGLRNASLRSKPPR
jgi:hypothetical protein